MIVFRYKPPSPVGLNRKKTMRTSTIKAFTLGFAASTILTTAIGFAAHANADTSSDEMTPQEIAYATKYEQYICGAIIGNPTNLGVYKTLAMIHNDGWTGYQSGMILGYAVQDACPSQWPVLEKFVADVEATQGSHV